MVALRSCWHASHGHLVRAVFNQPGPLMEASVRVSVKRASPFPLCIPASPKPSLENQEEPTEQHVGGAERELFHLASRNACAVRMKEECDVEFLPW